MYTPNKRHYNFDVTSPYYINITHRRKENVPKISLLAEELYSNQPINLFKLTENNLEEFTAATGDNEQSRTSLVDKWRAKVSSSQRTSILPKDSINFSELIDSFNFENCTETDFIDMLSSTKLDAQNGSIDDTFLTAQNSIKFIKSPTRQPDHMYQITEKYVHTDTENNIQLYERIIRPETGNR